MRCARQENWLHSPLDYFTLQFGCRRLSEAGNSRINVQCLSYSPQRLFNDRLSFRDPEILRDLDPIDENTKCNTRSAGFIGNNGDRDAHRFVFRGRVGTGKVYGVEP
jgi:hypothetical protein